MQIYFRTQDTITISYIPRTSSSLLCSYILLTCQLYQHIITTLNSLFWPPLLRGHISFPPTLNTVQQHTSFADWNNTFYSSFPPWLHISLPSISLWQEDLIGSWVIYSFHLCQRGRYERFVVMHAVADMMKCTWENGWKVGSSHQDSVQRYSKTLHQTCNSIISFLLLHMLYTHPLWANQELGFWQCSKVLF